MTLLAWAGMSSMLSIQHFLCQPRPRPPSNMPRRVCVSVFCFVFLLLFFVAGFVCLFFLFVCLCVVGFFFWGVGGGVRGCRGV